MLKFNKNSRFYMFRPSLPLRYYLLLASFVLDIKLGFQIMKLCLINGRYCQLYDKFSGTEIKFHCRESKSSVYFLACKQTVLKADILTTIDA